MAMRDFLVPEFDHEMAVTRRVLERVPMADAAWKPHPRSFSLGELATHIAQLPTWAQATLRGDSMDLQAPDAPARPTVPAGTPELLERFDRHVAAARALLADTSDAEMMLPWTLRAGEHVVFTLPRAAVLRSFIFSHTIHHRGQLTVYLRMRDVPVPSIYGPSADEH
jgi:uncharacterized damage-inducible protein DinB